MMAADLKDSLSLWIDDEETVYLLNGTDIPRAIPLYELDRQKRYDHMTAIAVEGKAFWVRKKKTFTDLLNIMDLIRSDPSCLWERTQTHNSLKPYIVEEAWETVDAIEEKDPAHIAEELGDLLLQVVFHSSIGSSSGEFTICDVITHISDKLIRRRPAVFSDTGEPGHPLDSADSLSWEEIKQKERDTRTRGESLRHICSSLPSIQYAGKILKHLDSLSSLPRSPEMIVSSISSLLSELNTVVPSDLPNLLGKLLFYISELSFRFGYDGEILLHHTAKHIIDAYCSAEYRYEASGQPLENLTFSDLGI